MTSLDRRKFIGVTAAGASALSSIAGCGRQTGLDEVLLTSVGDAVLPEELTTEGTARVTANFVEWVSGYSAGAELNHGYGSGSLAYADDLPLDNWSEQLHRLDVQARERFGSSLAQVTKDERRMLIRGALQDFPDAQLGNPARAEHIAVAVLSFFCRSSEATDMAYRASIKKQQCRPLDDSPNQPITLG